MSLMLLCRGVEPILQEIVYKAFVRSFSAAQVELVSVIDWRLRIAEGLPMTVVVVNPTTEWHTYIKQTLAVAGSKVLMLGTLPANTAKYLSIEIGDFDEWQRLAFDCLPAETCSSADSAAAVSYIGPASLGISSPIAFRPCTHYDFMAEWNNLGYGRIGAGADIWSVASCAKIPEKNRLADIEVDNKYLCSYAGLWRKLDSNLLWFNRAVGPVDSQEWRLVEYFFSSYSPEDSRCLPVLQEIPQGYDACVTMRLDCDEDISSSAPLFDLYQSEKIPFSLALHTSVIAEAGHHLNLEAVIASGGCLLSHSVTHPVNWGGSYEEASHQAIRSRKDIQEALPGVRLDYAVSPFHQNPPYALQALADASYQGFVGGIICNDPEYLMARGGVVPHVSGNFIGHSQQCMLHGESLLNSDDSLANFKKGFDIALAGRSLFGYLDHPFSPRYQYGWSTEEQRALVHKNFIDYIRSAGEILFINQNDALDWLVFKSNIQLGCDTDGNMTAKSTKKINKSWVPIVEYKGKMLPLEQLVT